MQLDVQLQGLYNLAKNDRRRRTRAEGGTKPVDLAYLSRFTLGNQSLECEVLDLFILHIPRYLAALRDAVTAKGWHDAAHTLKGSGRAVGAWRVARLAEHAERQLNVMNRPACQDAIARIKIAAEEARAFITATYAAA